MKSFSGGNGMSFNLSFHALRVMESNFNVFEGITEADGKIHFILNGQKNTRFVSDTADTVYV